MCQIVYENKNIFSSLLWNAAGRKNANISKHRKALIIVNPWN